MMLDQKTDTRLRAFAQLDTLKQMADRGDIVDADFVAAYDQALDQIESLGEDIKQFRLPAGSLKTNPNRTGGTPMVSKPLMYSKLTTLLTYFSIRTEILAQASARKESPAKMIGFDQPN